MKLPMADVSVGFFCKENGLLAQGKAGGQKAVADVLQSLAVRFMHGLERPWCQPLLVASKSMTLS